MGPPSSVRQGTPAFRWRADDGPTLNTGLVALWFFRGSRPVLLENPIFLWFFKGGGGHDLLPPPPPPLWIRTCLSTNKFDVNTQNNCFNETVTLNTQNECYNWWKRKHSQFYPQTFVNLGLCTCFYVDTLQRQIGVLGFFRVYPCFGFWIQFFRLAKWEEFVWMLSEMT